MITEEVIDLWMDVDHDRDYFLDKAWDNGFTNAYYRMGHNNRYEPEDFKVQYEEGYIDGEKERPEKLGCNCSCEEKKC